MSSWSEKYSVRIDSLDKQHKKLFQLIDELEEIVKDFKEEHLAHLLIEIKSYALYHFAAEERLMEQYGYPELDEHKAEHKKFELHFEKFIDNFDEDNLALAKEILAYLYDWLKNHILIIDRKYSQFFNEKGLE
jgi:hemerythrin